MNVMVAISLQRGDIIGIREVESLFCGDMYNELAMHWRRDMRIEHIAMYVNNLEAAKEFFIKYFNATANDGYYNNRTGFRSYFLSFADGARLEIMNKPGLFDNVKEMSRTGYTHIALSVGSKEKVDELTHQLEADGYEVISDPRTTGDGYYESCIIGIGGNQIEITV